MALSASVAAFNVPTPLKNPCAIPSHTLTPEEYPRALPETGLEEINRDLPEADFSFTLERHGFDSCKAAPGQSHPPEPGCAGVSPGSN
jgi:hypothetical protein